MEEKFEANAFTIGMFMSVMSIVTASVSSQLGMLRKLISERQLLIYSSIFYMASMVLMAYGNSRALIIISIIIFGIGHGLFIPNIQNMLVGYASINERAGFMSIFSMVLRIGQTLGPIAVVLFYDMGGLQSAFIAGASVALLMALISLIFINKSRI